MLSARICTSHNELARMAQQGLEKGQSLSQLGGLARRGYSEGPRVNPERFVARRVPRAF